MNQPVCYPPIKQPHDDKRELRYVKYVPVGYADTHSKTVGYLCWLIGFTGAHRFYYGKPLTGLLWLLTCGLLGVGWIVDLFLIPSMDREADRRFIPGQVDYNLAWILFACLGWFGVHRFYRAKIFTGLAYLLTGGLFGIGIVYDAFTLNDQISVENQKGLGFNYAN